MLTEPEIGPSWADFPLTLNLRKELVAGSQSGVRDLHNTVGCFGFDLKVGSGGMVEILVEELVGLLEVCSAKWSIASSHRLLALRYR